MKIKLLDFFGFIGITLLILICFRDIPKLGFQTGWDDQWVVMNPYTTGGLNLQNIWEIFTTYYHGQYSPINQLYYTFIYSFFKYDPKVYHCAGLLIHCLNVAALFVFISKLVSVLKLGNGVNARLVAFLTCGIFAIHPLTVESVAWLSASKVLLYALFFLIALTYYLSYLETKYKSSYLTCLVFFILSILSKEQAIVLPIILVLIDFLYNGYTMQKSYFLEKIPFFIVSILFGVVTILSQAYNHQGLLSNGDGYDFIQRICYASYSLFEYSVKCLFPYKVQYLYPFPNKVDEVLPLRFYIYPVLMLLVVYGFWKHFKEKLVAFSIGFFLINLILVLHIIPIARVAIIADRYAYLSIIGMAFLISMALVKVSFQQRHLLKYVIVGIVIYISYLGYYTSERVPKWQNTDSIKQEVREAKKRFRSH